MANPVTDVVRPVADLLAYANAGCTAAGVPSRVYTGTTYAGLAETIPSLLVESKGQPIAVVCYGGSKYGNSPRRVASVIVMVIQGVTRVAFGSASAIEAAEKIVSQIDDVVYQDTTGDDIITEKWKVVEDDVVDIDGLDAAACVILTFTVEDW